MQATEEQTGTTTGHERTANAEFVSALFQSLPPKERAQLGSQLQTEIAELGRQALSAAGPDVSVADWVKPQTPQVNGDPAPTILRIVNADIPFLVDSVMNTLLTFDIEAMLLLHPVFEVARDSAGVPKSVAFANSAGRSAGDRAPDVQRESLILIGVQTISEALANRVVDEIRLTLQNVKAAVRDWQPMLQRFGQAVEALEATETAASDDQRAEAAAFARWLLGGQFVFLGMREFRLVGDAETGELEVIEGSNLGVLENPNVHVLRRGTQLVALTPEIRRFYFSPEPLFVSKSSVVSRVHRGVHMDYVGLKTYEADGRLRGELRIVGLFTSKAYTMSPGEIPLLRRKSEHVIAKSGYVPGSHDAKALLNVIDTFPRDELFQIPLDMLCDWAPQIVDLETRPNTRVFARIDPFDRYVSVLVFLARERFSTVVRERIGHLLADKYGGNIVMFQPFFTEGRLVRVHYIVGRFGGRIPNTIDLDQVEDQVADITRSWRDRLANAIASEVRSGKSVSSDIANEYCAAFPSSYTESLDVARGLVDALHIEQLSELEPVDVRLYWQADRRSRERALAPPNGEMVNQQAMLGAVIYSAHGPIPLSERVPAFENMGFRAVDERSYQIKPPGRLVELHDMRLDVSNVATDELNDDALRRIEDGYRAVQSGLAESDRYNALITLAGLTWRQAAVFRAYGFYLRQAGVPFGPNYIAETLAGYGAITKLLNELFQVRFDPDFAGDIGARELEEARINSEIETALGAVPSLDEDRIVRSVRTLIFTTARTNFFKPDRDGKPAQTIAFKLKAEKLAMLPAPRPYREIWVYSPRVEGVHLRFAPIARGGLRWSDRAQDFRTEVLGLAKAQQVKNTVIVPEGAKGGFFAKQLPSPANREAFLAEGVAAYKIFIGAMVDITDNIVGGEIAYPDRVVRRDGDDPYLVVAADKGTATFSDFANELSLEKGHWLGDAFASGGSAGYDHKKMGITARGAWECVKRHFRELDHDIQTQPFSAVGVGDMSGDVFGNGMLLSPVTQLIAAFDHRDIFVDPNPDPETTFRERKRLFDLGRSNWQDYDTSLLSQGGGIFPRSAKSIALTPEIQARLGIEETDVTPNDLMRAILRADADLLWFGGIGTYVRAESETNSSVGDRANDAIRVTASELRVRAVGEGANLGMTQPARVAFAERGGRINTDFIDNSAGVNSSDLEVNIKIGLKAAIDSGALAADARNDLLVRMTDDVAQACLRNNQQQALAISLVEYVGPSRLSYLTRLMQVLEERGLLDRALEGLPDNSQLAERAASGRSLERPEIAVLLSYAKIALASDLISSQLANDPALEPLLLDYFPTEMRGKYGEAIRQHRLRKEIIVTRIANSMINRGGPALVVRLGDETGRTVGEMAKAVMATRDIFSLPSLWQRIETLGFDVQGAVQLHLLAKTQHHLFDQAAASLRAGESANLDAMIAAEQPTVARISEELVDSFATEQQIANLKARVDELTAQGVPEDLARDIEALTLVRFAPLVRRLSGVTGATTEATAKAVFQKVEAFRLLDLIRAARTDSVTDYYDRLALSSAFASIERAVFDAARMRLTGGDVGNTRLATAAGHLTAVADAPALSVSRLTVVASQVRDLVQG